MTARSLRLTVSERQSVMVGTVTAHQVTLTISNNVNIPAELFVVMAAPTADEPDRVEYKTVAAAADLDNLSAGSPPVEDPLQPYRVASVEITSDTAQMIDEFIISVRRRLADLLRALKSLEDFNAETTYDIELL